MVSFFVREHLIPAMNMKTNDLGSHLDDGTPYVPETNTSERTEEPRPEIGDSMMPPKNVDEHSLLHTVEVSTHVRDNVTMNIYSPVSSHNTTTGLMLILRAIYRNSLCHNTHTKWNNSARYCPSLTHPPKQRSPQKTLLDAKPSTTSV
jgi:hypothetical protein